MIIFEPETDNENTCYYSKKSELIKHYRDFLLTVKMYEENTDLDIWDFLQDYIFRIVLTNGEYTGTDDRDISMSEFKKAIFIEFHNPDSCEVWLKKSYSDYLKKHIIGDYKITTGVD